MCVGNNLRCIEKGTMEEDMRCRGGGCGGVRILSRGPCSSRRRRVAHSAKIGDERRKETYGWPL